MLSIQYNNPNRCQIGYVHFHETLDIVVPWVSGHDTRERLPSVFEDFSRWVIRNGCDNVQMQTYNDGKKRILRTFDGTDDGVRGAPHLVDCG